MRQGDARILKFPAERSLGQLFSVYQDEEIYLGEAQGRISVPIDDLILLVLRRMPPDGLDFLQDLEPDALFALCLRDKNVSADDLANLEHMSGLCVLDLGNIQLPDNYIDYLYPLNNLSELDLSGAAKDRYEIEALAELEWLQHLKLGFLDKSQERDGWTWGDIRNALPMLTIRYGLMDVCEKWTRLSAALDAEFTPPISFDAKDLIVPGPVLEKRYKKWMIRVTCSYDSVFQDVSLTVEAKFKATKDAKFSLGVEDKAFRPEWERSLVGLYTSLAEAVGARKRIKTGVSAVDGSSDFQVRAREVQPLQALLGVDRIREILIRPDIVGDKFKYWRWGVEADATGQSVSAVSFVHQTPFIEFPRMTSAKLRRVISLIEDTLDQLVKIGVAE